PLRACIPRAFRHDSERVSQQERPLLSRTHAQLSGSRCGRPPPRDAPFGTKLTRIAAPPRPTDGENVAQSRRSAGRCRTGSIVVLTAIAAGAATAAAAATVGG